MKADEYRKWRRNGNFTISQSRLLQVDNHIAEGERGCYTKSEAAQVATYWSLKYSALCNERANEQCERLIGDFKKAIRKMKTSVSGD